jgi:hypothetical protein
VVAEPRCDVGQRLGRVRALVDLLGAVREDRDDPLYIERSLEPFDARLEERRRARVTVLLYGRRAARRM